MLFIVYFLQLQFPNQNEPSNILQKWDQTSKMEYGHFEHKELSLSQKIALFNMAGIRAQRKIEDSYKVSQMMCAWVIV